MAEYTAIFNKPYADGYEDLPSQNTPITAQTLNDKDAVIEHIEDYLSTNDIPTYDEKTSTSGEFKTLSGGIMGSCVINLSLVQSGSGTPSPDNVRPITGHSSVDNRVIDKDLLTHTATTQTLNGLTFTVSGTKITVNGTATAQTYIEIGSTGDLPQGDYWYSGLPSDASNNTYFITRSASSNNTASDKIWNTSGVQVPRLYVRNGITCNNVVFDIAISKAYEKTTTPLGQTVYGGSVDVVSGVLTIDKVCDTFDGSNDETIELVYGAVFNRISCAISSDSITNSSTTEKTDKIWSDKYEEITDALSNSGSTGIYYRSNGSHKVMISAGEVGVTDVASARTWLSSNPVQICYVLATPIIIQLTPQQIETLIGQNTVSVPLDGQSLDSLTYREVLAWDDVERAVAVKLDLSSVAPIEYTDKASRSYNQKQLFIKDGKLGQALTSISSGASFTENTNFKYTTLAEIIEPLIP